MRKNLLRAAKPFTESGRFYVYEHEEVGKFMLWPKDLNLKDLDSLRENYRLMFDVFLCDLDDARFQFHGGYPSQREWIDGDCVVATVDHDGAPEIMIFKGSDISAWADGIINELSKEDPSERTVEVFNLAINETHLWDVLWGQYDWGDA
jgi:hypothetical protein